MNAALKTVFTFRKVRNLDRAALKDSRLGSRNMMNTGQTTTAFNLLILLVTVVVDLGGLGGGAYHRRVTRTRLAE